MKKTSRFLALAVAFCLVLSLGAVSFAAESGASWSDYQDYLYNASVGNAPDAQEWHDQVYALKSWDDIDMSTSPWDMIFSESGPNLTTWAEFQASGTGAASSVVGSTMAASTDSAASGTTSAKSSGVPSADTSAAKSSGVPSADTTTAKSSGVPSGDKTSGVPASDAADVTASVTETTADMKVSDYASLNNFARDDSGYITVGVDVVDGAVTDQSNWDSGAASVTLDNEVDGAAFTAVHASGEDSDVSVTGTLILKNTDADSDGTHASDFSGTGCAIVAANGATVKAEDLTVVTDGFVRAGLILDNNCVGWVENSSITAYGANPLTEAYDGYENSANTGVMISPPWVLGIQGGIRTINVLDNACTLIVKDSYLASGGWGVISTDGCTSPYIYVIDSQLEILPESEGGMDSGYALYGYDADAYGSGYGAYIIGNTVENVYGSDISGCTYAAIVREGTISYQSSTGDIALTSAADEDLGTVTGKGAVTTINTVFGGMTHSSEDVEVDFLDGTVVNTEEASILYRTSGHAVFNVDSAELNTKSGIILQMMDDDDSTVGGFSPFNEFLYEDAGLPSSNGNETGATDNCEEATLTLTNGVYTGNFYNGTGYYSQAGDVMNLVIGKGAEVTGDAALTETLHGIAYSADAVKALDALGSDVTYVLLDKDFAVTENAASAAYIQLTQFSIRQYYMLCHVLNHVYNNGYSGVNVTVEDGGVWTVAENSLINYLKVDGGTVYGVLTENADGTLTITPSATKTIADGEYGTEVVANVAVSSGMGNAMKGEGMPSADKTSGVPSGTTTASTDSKASGVPSGTTTASTDSKTSGVPSGTTTASGSKTSGVPSGSTTASTDSKTSGVPSGTTTASADSKTSGVPSGTTTASADSKASGVPSGSTTASGSKTSGVPSGSTTASGSKTSGVPSGSKTSGVPSGSKTSGVPSGSSGNATQTITVGGKDYTVTVYTIDGVEYVKLDELADLFGFTVADETTSASADAASKDAGVPSGDKTTGAPSASAAGTSTTGKAAAGTFSDADYAAFDAYFASATASVPPDVPNYEDIQNMKLDDYSSLKEAEAAVDAAVAIPDLSGVSGEMPTT